MQRSGLAFDLDLSGRRDPLAIDPRHPDGCGAAGAGRRLAHQLAAFQLHSVASDCGMSQAGQDNPKDQRAHQ